MSKWHLKHKTALVTGGSKGIGKAIVKEFSELGAEVLFTGRSSDLLKKVEKEFKELGFRVHSISGDVAVAAHRQKVAEWIQGGWGKLDILVNNAGINIRKPTLDYTRDEYMKVLDTDLLAPFEFCRLLFPLLKTSGNASIINVASVAGSHDVKTGSPYGMSKSGLLQLTRSLANEWAHEGIRVNSVSPWMTETPLTEALLADAERRERIHARTPMKRIARDEEMASVVAFLAMEKSSYLTGQNIIVDGGATSALL